MIITQFRFISVFLLITVLAGYCYSQNLSNEPVAKIGSKEISQEEFLKRYELTPFVKKDDSRFQSSSKLSFLYTLAAEKLLALEAEAEGLDQLPVIRFSVEQVEKMFARHKLFEFEISNKINPTDNEIIEDFGKYNSTLYVKFLFSTDEEEIYNLHSFLENGIHFDSILIESPEFEEQKEPIEIVYGQMDESVEDFLFALSPGEFTTPILTPDGWYIFKLINRSEQTLNTEEDKREALNEIKKVIEARQTRKLYNKFYEYFFKDLRIDIDPVLFESLTQKISKQLSLQSQANDSSDTRLFNLSSDDVIEIENSFGEDSLELNFVLLPSDPLSLKSVIRTLAFNGFNSEKSELTYLRAKLDYQIKDLIEKELLSREAIKRGYHLLPEVREEVEMWKENYLFQAIQNKFLDSVRVTEKELKEHYNKISKPENYPPLVNIIEILTDSLEAVDLILRELEEGKDFEELALVYNKREATQSSGGVYGLNPFSYYGEIGTIASEMEIGEVYGPLELPEGYSIFKVIDKEDEKVIMPDPFEKVRDKIYKEVVFTKVKGKLAKFTARLAVKYGVGINTEVLNSIQVTNINSFGIRYLGFGGSLTAVPLVAPNTDWVEEWIKKQQELP